MQRKTWYSLLGLDAMPLYLKNLLCINLINIFFSDETSHQGQSQTSQESSEVPDVKVEAPEAMAEVNESNDENNTSLGNLTADSTGMLDAPSFPSVGIKVNITSQVRFSLFVALFCKFH